MVTRSVVDYEQHKTDIYNIINSKYPKYADKFINFYADRYDKFNRSYIDYRLAFWLMDDYKDVTTIGTRWYGCVGIGGTGKTTFMKNVLYFLDPQIELSCVCFSMLEFVKKLKDFPTIGAKRAILIDEPDDDLHPGSVMGKKLRNILGKIRQQQLFIAICATDLKDIPPYIFRKLNGIFFTPETGRYMFFKDRPKKESYVIQRIRNKYSDKGYSIFKEYRKSVGCLSGRTMVGSPLDLLENKAYLLKKKIDYEKDIDDFIKQNNNKDKPNISERDKIILSMNKQGYNYEKICDITNLTKGRISQIVKNNEIKQDV